MPFLELSLHITDQHLDPRSSWREIPERTREIQKDTDTSTIALMETFYLSAEFPHLAERALAEDFEQFKLRWISFLAALFYMVGDRNLLICPFVLHKPYQYETAAQDCRSIILHAPRPHAHHYLHSVRKTLPPPWARPWSHAHWPAAKPKQSVRVSISKHFDKALSSLFSTEQDYECSCCTPTRMTEDSTDEIDESHGITVRFHFSPTQALFVVNSIDSIF